MTDHKPLTTILGPKKGIPVVAASRLQRWAMLLAAYTYDIQYRSTHDNRNADGLSRLPLQEDRPDVEGLEASVFSVEQIEALPVTAAHLRQATRSDPILSKVLQNLRQGNWPDQRSEALSPYANKQHALSIENDTLLWGIRVVIPAKLRQEILQELHHNHPGISRMKSLARGHVWWPSIDKDIDDCVHGCTACQEVKTTEPLAPLHPWVWPGRPWQRGHVDFAGPINGKMFILLVDAHSKWPEVFEMSNTTSQKTIEILRQAYKLPEHIVSDNGPQFISREFAEFMAKNGIKHIRSAPYHPATNGQVERFVQTFKRAMKTSITKGTLNQRLCSFFVVIQNHTPQCDQCSPMCSISAERGEDKAPFAEGNY